jgi:AraC family transcriptional regulator, arabinose operon regulatory protein
VLTKERILLHLFTGDTVTSRRIIYQPSQFARDNLFYLQETGELKALKTHTSRRSNLSSYLLFIVTGGTGTLLYSGKNYSMKKGDCAFLDCREEYSQSSSDSDLWSLKWAHFNGRCMGGIYSKYLERGGEPCFKPSDTTAFITLLDTLLETASSNICLRDMKINEYLSTLLTLLMGYSWNPERAKTSHTRIVNISDVRKFIDNNYYKKLSLETVAKKFNINKSYLLRSFKEETGLTINGYILQQRILKAKNDLRFTNKTLYAIAEDCGFGDANYFIRMFKKVEGITPGEYRKQW